MKKIEATIDIAADADAVWKAAGDPATLADWAPALAGSHLEGDVRHVEFADGGGVGRERILARDDALRSYTYRYLDGPIPLDEYESTIQVVPKDVGSAVVWTAEFTAAGDDLEAELATTIAGMYQAALENLKSQLEL